MRETEHDVRGASVAILATHGFEESELHVPREALERAGAGVRIISLPSSDRTITGWSDGTWGEEELDVDESVQDVRADDFDALVLPGGVKNPDKLRMHPDAVAFVRDFIDQKKPVAAICHAPWMLVEADALRGRSVTSYPSLRTDLENAGANWEDTEVVVDGLLVTSRKPKDLPAFVEATLDLVERHHRHAVAESGKDA